VAHLFDLVWRPVAILLATRLTAWVVVYLAHPLAPADPMIGARSPLLTRSWDGRWYMMAAQHGWPHYVPNGPSTLPFLPALPELIRIVHGLTPLGWTWSAFAAAFITQIAMVIAVWHLTRDIWGIHTANRATILLCFFPGALVLSLVYSEPLLIASAAACMLCLRKRRWVLAGLFAAVGTATGPNDFPLIVCCAWEAFFAIRQRRDWSSLTAVVLSASGVGAWFAYLWASTGVATAWSTANRRGWNERPDLLAFLRIVHRVELQGSHDLRGIVVIASTVVALTLLVVLISSKPPAMLVVFSSIVLALSIFSGPYGLGPRFVMAAFPLLMGLGYRLKGEIFGLTVGVSAMLMSALLVVTLSTIGLVP
jgi:hypothetical protein